MKILNCDVKDPEPYQAKKAGKVQMNNSKTDAYGKIAVGILICKYTNNIKKWCNLDVGNIIPYGGSTVNYWARLDESFLDKNHIRTSARILWCRCAGQTDQH